MISDVTKVKKFEMEKVVDKFKAMYLQIIAHDLRTPLITIISMCEHIKLFYTHDDMVQSTMKFSVSQCSHLIQIVD